MSFFAHFDINHLLVAVTALSTALTFVAAIYLCAQCYLCPRRSGVSGPITGFFPRPLEYPPDDYYSFQVLNGGGTRATDGLDAKALTALPVFTWVSDIRVGDDQGGAPVEPVWCAICLRQMVDGELGRPLSTCRHVFQVECIDKWFHISKTCPICRTRVEAAADVRALR